MTRLVLRRLVALLALLVVLSIIVFALSHVAAGDPVRNLIGARKATPELVAAVRAQYHLDEPVWTQYWYWLSGVLGGDFGSSVRTGQPVADVIAARVPVTVTLTALTAVLSIGLGIPLGVAAANREGKFIDRMIVVTAVGGVSAPSFAVALLLIYFFAVVLHWFPIYGVGEGGWDFLRHLILPCLALTAGVTASIIKITRAGVLVELGKDHVVYYRSRGLGRSHVLRTLLRGAALPILTSAGLVVASLAGGAVLVETTFALPGLGVLLTDSIHFKDVPVVQAITLLVAVVIALTTFIVDLVAIVIDPRLREHV
ncbi:MAG: ABC transporter permease [Propionibacteriaceae bacterium]|jgi:peptide/nickel transport system permease protein|nr:ABC transporter permease [Propionibacteriaceae bacterium]